MMRELHAKMQPAGLQPARQGGIKRTDGSWPGKAR